MIEPELDQEAQAAILELVWSVRAWATEWGVEAMPLGVQEALEAAEAELRRLGVPV